jgi:sec-independent protein translocase protein TatC
MAKSKKSPKGEMPFLDHLEELRWRILRSLAALIVGTVVGFLVVQNFDVLELLKQPIAPYLPDGRLIVTRPTDAFFVTLKLAFLIGLVLSAPVILGQAWAFLSPALYEDEKRYITPALMAGLGLFLAGAFMAYLWVLPVALKFLLTNFQWEDLDFFITASAYFGFATQLILAFGLMFEVPLFMVLLAALGLIGPKGFAKHRPLALVISSILAAMLTPPDIASMLMLMLPVVLLYEVGILVSRMVWKQRESPRTER